MADWADDAAAVSELHLTESIRRARQPVAAGVKGICENCDEESPRLVGGRCAPCRDGRYRRGF